MSDSFNLLVLSVLFSGCPFAYAGYFVCRLLGWRDGMFRILLLGFALGAGLAFAGLRLLGQDGLLPAACGMVGWFCGFGYGVQRNQRRSRRAHAGPDRTQRALFELMRQQEEQAQGKGR